MELYDTTIWFRLLWQLFPQNHNEEGHSVEDMSLKVLGFELNLSCRTPIKSTQSEWARVKYLDMSSASDRFECVRRRK